MDLTPFERFEEWLTSLPPPHYNAPIPPNGPEALILQNRDEIKAFAEVLQEEPSRHVALEIGIGSGGTHHLWRLLYDVTVVTVDVSQMRVGLCLGLMRCHLRANEAPASSFVVADSTLPKTALTVATTLKHPVDMLFIDGGHDYEVVEADHRLYSPLVRDGGIVAFHDAISPLTGVPRFLHELGATVKLNFITHERSLQGIAWYHKGAEI